jgi:hypothetical protein
MPVSTLRQDMHAPEHPLLQQTPSTHVLLTHSLAEPQA